jgi:hypothetical protein
MAEVGRNKLTDVLPPRKPRYPSTVDSPDAAWASELIRLLEVRDREVNAAYNIIELNADFAIDAQTLVTITINNVFGYIPDVKKCQISIVEKTNVDDWAYDLLKIESISATQVVAKINVSTASGTGSAKATAIIWVRA